VILETVLRVIFTTGGKAGAAELRAHQQWEHMMAHAEGSIGAPKARGEEHCKSVIASCIIQFCFWFKIMNHTFSDQNEVLPFVLMLKVSTSWLPHPPGVRWARAVHPRDRQLADRLSGARNPLSDRRTQSSVASTVAFSASNTLLIIFSFFKPNSQSGSPPTVGPPVAWRGPLARGGPRGGVAALAAGDQAPGRGGDPWGAR